MNPLRHAQSLIKANISVIPIKTDGSKRPAVPWKGYQEMRMTVEEAERLFSSDCGIGIIAGAVSGNLEIIDVEGRANVAELLELIEETVPGLLANIPQVRTPSGGLHLYYRCETIEGNQKLALQANADHRPEVLIETRGEGRYVLSPGSPPPSHTLNKPYVLRPGVRISQTPVIALEQRAQLLDCARSFNTYVPCERYEQALRNSDLKHPPADPGLPGAD